MSQEKCTLSVPEAANRLGIGRNLAYEAIRRGEIPVVKVDRRILVPVAALKRLLGEASVRISGVSPDDGE